MWVLTSACCRSSAATVYTFLLRIIFAFGFYVCASWRFVACSVSQVGKSQYTNAVNVLWTTMCTNIGWLRKCGARNRYKAKRCSPSAGPMSAADEDVFKKSGTDLTYLSSALALSRNSKIHQISSRASDAHSRNVRRHGQRDHDSCVGQARRRNMFGDFCHSGMDMSNDPCEDSGSGMKIRGKGPRMNDMDTKAAQAALEAQIWQNLLELDPRLAMESRGQRRGHVM